MIKLSKEEWITELVEAGIRLTSYAAVMIIGKKVILDPMTEKAELKRNLAITEITLSDLRCDIVNKEIEELENK